MSLAALELQALDGRFVVRDDLLPGGTKRRALPAVLQAGAEHVYASPAFGYAQLALAHAAVDVGAKATVFVAERKEPTALTLAAKAAGAKVLTVPFGRLSNVRAKARRYCELSGARLVPFGVDCAPFIDRLAEVAARLRIDGAPVGEREVWAVAGSGVLTRALQQAFPKARHRVVLVGTEAGHYGQAELERAPEAFEQAAQEPPPFPSAAHYDAKLWRFFHKAAAPGALFWNVGA